VSKAVPFHELFQKPSCTDPVRVRCVVDITGSFINNLQLVAHLLSCHAPVDLFITLSATDLSRCPGCSLSVITMWPLFNLSLHLQVLCCGKTPSPYCAVLTYHYTCKYFAVAKHLRHTVLMVCNEFSYLLIPSHLKSLIIACSLLWCM
jgi:hypothetical protein